MWDELARRGVAAFPLPPHGRIPNFKGADRACEVLRRTQEWASARVVKVNPDSPQQPCREAALREGKLLIMPTPRIRQGFLLLDPGRVDARRASTIRGAFEFGEPVDPASLPRIDMVVIGSVAVNPGTGARLGKSHGYAELEWGILAELGRVGEDTPVATTVHEVQLVSDDIPVEPFDLPVDIIATPSRLIRVARGRPKPRGILREFLTEELLAEIPLLRRFV